ncbi:hypothetical protein HanRHA438_Chr03g0131691 [Helianthus annuus]|nr:hypothetical protein HanRHA438_Chr03g0131691 [Helianthus annuus]
MARMSFKNSVMVRGTFRVFGEPGFEGDNARSRGTCKALVESFPGIFCCLGRGHKWLYRI